MAAARVKISLLLVVAACFLAQTEGQQSSTTTAPQIRGRLGLLPRLRNARNNEQPRSSRLAAPSTTSSTTTTTTTTSTTTTTTAKPATASSIRARAVASPAANSSARLEFVEDELPADFYEMPPEQLDLGMNATGRAPVPVLNVAVLQNGQMIDSAINVHPGTPLEMVIYLDDKSAKVYGLLATYLKVQDDTFRQREEVIINNACSIDTYIFGNFENNPEDQSLRAKFRAFKFPDSNYVRFVGTVNVCIKQCPKVDCQGKRKRRSTQSSSSNISLTVSTVLKIGNPSSELQKI